MYFASDQNNINPITRSALVSSALSFISNASVLNRAHGSFARSRSSTAFTRGFDIALATCRCCSITDATTPYCAVATPLSNNPITRSIVSATASYSPSAACPRARSISISTSCCGSHVISFAAAFA